VIDAYRELWQRLDRLPGVSASGGVSALPLSGFFSWGPITVEGRTPPPSSPLSSASPPASSSFAAATSRSS